MCAATVRQTELSALGFRTLDRIDLLVEVMCRRVRDELSFYSTGAGVSPDALRRSVHTNIVPVLHSLSTSTPLDLEPASSTGRERAEQDAPLPDVLRAFRIGFECLWSDLVETARTTGVASDASLVDAATTVWRLAGDCTEAIATAYRERSTQLAVQLEHRRVALLDALFRGTTTDTTTLWDVAEVLRVPLTGRFLVAITASSDPLQPSTRIDARLGQRGARSLWRWQPDAQSCLIDLGSAKEERVLADLEATATADTGVSGLFEHLRDTPHALHCARVALTTLAHPRGKVVQYDITPLGTLVSAAPVEAERVAREVLGGVLALKAHESATLIRTLRVWCACDGAASRSAEELHCHVNTLRYRLRKVEELSGRSLKNPREVAEVVMALNALRVVSQG